ncbi:MAG: hypothetical protein QM582_15555 [Micropruina sp.]|uniref:hypothetical protein n=1 Tax=Micropruina sp. TaxID=2737536 RepID=UPI0039E29862
MSWPAPTGEPVGPEQGSPTPPYPAPPAAGGPSGWNGTPTSSPQPTTAPPPPGATPFGAGTPPQAVAVAHGGIDTLAPTASGPEPLAPLSRRTGRPVRPWTIWLSAVLLFAGAGVAVAGLGIAMWQMASPWQEVGPGEWNKIDKFNEATWLTAQFPSEPGSGMRVLFAILCCLIAVLVAGTATAVGYYAFAGYRWTRIGALVALAVSALSLLLTPIASLSIGLVALGAAPLWLPPTRRFVARWQLIRHPQVAYSAPIDQVFYGPLPRYR